MGHLYERGTVGLAETALIEGARGCRTFAFEARPQRWRMQSGPTIPGHSRVSRVPHGMTDMTHICLPITAGRAVRRGARRQPILAWHTLSNRRCS
jgi:hypothetical protein